MNIRPAKAPDVHQIGTIALENNQTKEIADGTGFYEMPIPEEEKYKTRIADNPLALVAEENAEVIGFVLGYTDTLLYSLGVDRMMSEYLADKPRPFALIEAIAVKRGLQGGGTGEALFAKVIEQAESLGIPTLWCNIVHKPIKNKRSVPLVEKHDFTFVEELEVPEIGITFGIYRR